MTITGSDIPLPNDRPGMSLDEYRAELRKTLADGEMTCCAACGQPAKVYARPLNGTMMKALAALASSPNGLSNRDILAATRQGGGGNVSLLVHWSMVESWPGSVWRATRAGRLFLDGQWSAAHKVLLYNNRFLGFDTSRLVTVHDLLGEAFDRGDVMSAAAIRHAEVGTNQGGLHAAE